MEGDRKNQETKFCEKCKHHIPAAIFIHHEFHCSWYAVSVPKMEEHVQEKHIPCDRCFLMVDEDFMDVHLDSECPHRSVHCHFCDLDVQMSEYEMHVHFWCFGANYTDTKE